jgi:hypothetical protein
MPQEAPVRQPIAAAFARKVKDADAREIAALVTSTMGAIEKILSPIIGKGGVVAMYRRSLLVVGASHSWLAPSDSPRKEIDLATLLSLLAAQDCADAASAGGALLQTFHDLLASLVGTSLSQRLLRNVWADLDPGPQDQRT